MPVLAVALPRLVYMARLLWAGPLSLFGLCMGLTVLVAGGRWHIVEGSTRALLFRGRLADWLLLRHPAGRMNAMAIGHVVLATVGGLGERTLAHELEHVRQAERWGPLFPLLYMGASTWEWLNGRQAYRDNRFETAARAAEKTGRATLR